VFSVWGTLELKHMGVIIACVSAKGDCEYSAVQSKLNGTCMSLASDSRETRM